MSDIHRSRPSHELRADPDHTTFPSTSTRVSPYVYPMQDNSLRSGAVHESPLPYEPPSRSDQMLHDPSSVQVGHSYSYVSVQDQSRQQTHAIPIYGQTHSSVSSAQSWSLPSARPSSWLGPSDQSDRSFASATTAKVQRSATSPTWQRSSHHTNVSATAAPLNLPTLSSPFYPLDSTQDSLPSSSHPQSLLPSSYSSSSMQHQLLPAREYDSAELSLTSSLSTTAHPYHSNAGRDGMMYGQRQPGPSVGLPPISSYSQSLPSQFPTNPGSAPTQYWVRE
ncbi:hypothetical protein LshimejAT787_0906030 [Lyophyllum shimeji]|uniref:Uncharacterized protein n=1 Tax=Lyophyllum shimeji TaxID=47721 RepID=A0A9P3PTN8_LYOSH|nr:hypothetical protein LshimejAT787_0906030 [Lyophyllum shimeji]